MVLFWGMLGVGLSIMGGVTISTHTWKQLGLGIFFSYLGLIMFYLARREETKNNSTIFFWVSFLNGLLSNVLAIIFMYSVFKNLM